MLVAGRKINTAEDIQSLRIVCGQQVEEGRKRLAGLIPNNDVQEAILDGAVGNPQYCGPNAIDFRIFCENLQDPHTRNEMDALRQVEDTSSIVFCLEATAQGVVRADYLREIMQANEGELPDFLYEIIKNKLVEAASRIDDYNPVEHLGSNRDFSDIFAAQMTFLNILEQKGYDKTFVDEKRKLTSQKRKIAIGY